MKSKKESTQKLVVANIFKSYTAILIPKYSIALYNTFYSMSGKNGTLRDKAQYTDDILSKAQQQLFSMTVEIQIKNG